MEVYKIFTLALIILVGIILSLMVYYNLITKEQLQNAANELVYVVEEWMKSKPGKDKKSYVVGKIYAICPKWLQLFVSEKQLNDIVQTAWNVATKTYSDGHTILSK